MLVSLLEQGNHTSLLKRTPKNATLAILTIYADLAGLSALARGGMPSSGFLLLALIPALLGGCVLSGYLTIIGGAGGIQFVDPHRTQKQMAQARANVDVQQDHQLHQPTTNVEGSAMLGGIDVNGNSYGVTKSD